jgi:hypothetical protein
MELPEMNRPLILDFGDLDLNGFCGRSLSGVFGHGLGNLNEDQAAR